MSRSISQADDRVGFDDFEFGETQFLEILSLSACRTVLGRKNDQRSGIAGVCDRGGHPVISGVSLLGPEVDGLSLIMDMDSERSVS